MFFSLCFFFSVDCNTSKPVLNSNTTHDPDNHLNYTFNGTDKNSSAHGITNKTEQDSDNTNELGKNKNTKDGNDTALSTTDNKTNKISSNTGNTGRESETTNEAGNTTNTTLATNKSSVNATATASNDHGLYCPS